MAEDKTTHNEETQEKAPSAGNISNESETQAGNPEEHHEAKKKAKKAKIDPKDQKIAELENRIGELADKHLRLQAEFDNYRKRTLKEKAELIKSGGESVLAGLLPVVDDFDRAIDSMKNIADNDPAKIGILLIYAKFRDFLKQNNLQEIDALHKDFDCEFHEALTKIPSPSEELKGKNIDVVQKGYMLYDKVIRFSKVVVGE